MLVNRMEDFKRFDTMMRLAKGGRSQSIRSGSVYDHPVFVEIER